MTPVGKPYPCHASKGYVEFLPVLVSQFAGINLTISERIVAVRACARTASGPGPRSLQRCRHGAGGIGVDFVRASRTLPVQTGMVKSRRRSEIGRARLLYPHASQYRDGRDICPVPGNHVGV